MFCDSQCFAPARSQYQCDACSSPPVPWGKFCVWSALRPPGHPAQTRCTPLMADRFDEELQLDDSRPVTYAPIPGPPLPELFRADSVEHTPTQLQQFVIDEARRLLTIPRSLDQPANSMEVPHYCDLLSALRNTNDSPHVAKFPWYTKEVDVQVCWHIDTRKLSSPETLTDCLHFF